MDLTILFYAGIMIATGLLFGKLAKMAHLPNVTGYLVGGLLIGPSILNIIKESYMDSLDLVSMVALGFIAFTIGDEFKISYFKKVGAKPIIIAIMEASFGVLFVFIGLIVYFAIVGQLDITNIRFSLILSAVAAATDPAATLMVVKQYKAKGSLTDTILGVVALDDSVAVMLFGICVAVANAIGPSTAGTSLIIQILNPLKEIFFSLGIGAAMGFLLTYACLWFTGRGNRISLVVTMIFITIYLSDLVEGSTILACMALGAIFANFSKKYDEVNNLVYFFTPPIFIMFFVLSGAELKLSVLLIVGVIGIVYIFMRVFGKFFGAWLGARISKAEPKIANYLGFALLPQAGVAIGLSLVATQILDADMGSQIRAIVLAATLLYELSGPVVTKTILRKTGEITVRG